MDDKLIMIVLVFFVIQMLNKKKSCGCPGNPENFTSPSTFYETPSFGTKVDCSDPPVTFKKFIENEGIRWKPIHKSQKATQMIYSKYRNEYAETCPDSDYYAKFSYTI